MSCFVERLSFQNEEMRRPPMGSCDGELEGGGWRAEWIGLLEQHGRERDGDREEPVLVAWRRLFWPI